MAPLQHKQSLSVQTDRDLLFWQLCGFRNFAAKGVLVANSFTIILFKTNKKTIFARLKKQTGKGKGMQMSAFWCATYSF